MLDGSELWKGQFETQRIGSNEAYTRARTPPLVPATILLGALRSRESRQSWRILIKQKRGMKLRKEKQRSALDCDNVIAEQNESGRERKGAISKSIHNKNILYKKSKQFITLLNYSLLRPKNEGRGQDRPGRKKQTERWRRKVETSFSL